MNLFKSKRLKRAERKELKALRNLYVNLMSGAIKDIDPNLVRCLMEKDWTNG